MFDAPVTDPRDRPAPQLALYRRYRPDTFTDVIGQEHVTEPLQRALAHNRVHHAYLFSGPRGCGKTTSARILARALNCEKGPAAEPCGVCRSCLDLARGGPGSIDVIEIDAASHGGVDDARDLRERAFFAPVASRYKIYIVDEAHMVTTAGFNALLKLVEEPPPHVKFIFATTEPDKVIGTIRSRTHHYPFRLVPPRVLNAYLGRLCEAEGAVVEPAVLPLVVRAGAGSVRDTLSVLDQLLGGASDTGVSYAHAAALLGYTPDSLLDEVVDAFAAGDAAGVFGCVDKVIEVGQDPRRFAEDLLRRLRDLLVVAAVPDALTSGLVDVAADQAQRLTSQAATLGSGELTRAAEVIAAGLTEMRGTTAPRLHLELMCARVLLPGADVDDRGIHARLDRLERRIGMLGAGEPAASGPKEPPRPVPETADRPGPAPQATGPAPATEPTSEATAERPPEPPEPQRPESPRPESRGPEPQGPEPQGPEPPESPAQPGLSTLDVRRLWPEILEEVKRKRRFTWILLSQNASVAEVRDGTLLLALGNVGARDSFAKGGSEDVLREAIVVVLGADLRISTMVDPGTSAGAPRTATSPRSPAQPEPRPGPEASPPAPPVTPPVTDPAVRQQAREQIRPTRRGRSADKPADDRDAVAARDDLDLDEGSQSHADLLARHLGAQIIEEETHDR
ncbi:MAG: DNA polymerase III subunit gamma and tau [Actinomycetes bacterium]